MLGKNAEGGVYEGLWIIPAGGVKPGETILQTCIREVSEEVGIDITIEDDLSEIVWASFDELSAMKFSPCVEEMLKRLGCL